MYNIYAKMIEVFKTNIQNGEDAQQVERVLLHHLPPMRINFDLDDCDRILRIEAEVISIHEIIRLLTSMNFLCEVLPD